MRHASEKEKELAFYITSLKVNLVRKCSYKDKKPGHFAMNNTPGIGYHVPVHLMSEKVKVGKYIGLLISLLTTALFIMSKQYILLLWSFFIAGFISQDLYRVRKVSKNLSEQEASLSEYIEKALFYGSAQNENITFKMADKGIKNLCSYDTINHADELLRTVIICKDGDIFLRIRLIVREKIYAQVRQIPEEVATDMWVASQEARAVALGLPSPFATDD